MGREKRKNRLDKGSTGLSSGDFIGFGAFATETTSDPSNVSSKGNLRCSPVYTGGDSVLSIHFKKIGQKKDGSTKAKTLQLLKKFFEDDSKPKKEQVKAWEHLIFLYHTKLNYDDFPAVRCECLHVLSTAKKRLPKAWETLLKQEPEVLGMVWCASSDPSLDVRIASKHFCDNVSIDPWWNGVWLYVSRMLRYGRPKTMFEDLFSRRGDNEPMTDSEREKLDERYERLIVNSINGLTTWMQSFPETEESFPSRYDTTITDSILWKSLTNSRSTFRKASYQLLGAMCQNAKSVVYGSVGSNSLTKLIPSIVAQEKEAANVQYLFEVLLLYLKFRNDNEIKIEDVAKSLNKLLKKACFSASPQQWGPAILPILVSIGKENLILRVLSSMLEGRSATIGLSDSLLITYFAAESCSFFLLRSDEGNLMDHSTSISIAELWLECLKSYVAISGSTSISRSSENELRTILGKSLCRFDEAAYSKENCAFHRLKAWFWDTQLPTFLQSGSDQKLCRRFHELIREVSRHQKSEQGQSHLIPLIRREFQTFLVNLNSKSDSSPNAMEYEFLETCMEFCLCESIFSTDESSSGVTLESFLMDNVLQWLILYSLETKHDVTAQCEASTVHAFSCLRICLFIVESTERRQNLWISFLRELINADCNVKILAKGILTLCVKKKSETKSSVEQIIANDVLDDFAIKVVEDALVCSDAKLEVGDFLRVCLGLNDSLRTSLISKNVLSKWVDMLHLDQEFCDKNSVSVVLCILIDVADAKSSDLCDKDTLKVIMAAWYNGGKSWSKACANILARGASEPLYGEFLRASEVQLQSSICCLCEDDLDVTRSDLHEKCCAWSRRALRWFRSNDTQTAYEKLVSIGLGNAEMWKTATCNFKKCEQLRWCISSFLEGLENDTERFLLFFDSDMFEERVKLFTSILIATSCNPEKKKFESHDPSVLHWFGGCKSFGDDLIIQCVNQFLHDIMGAFDSTICMKKSICAFSNFITELFPVYLSDEKCSGRDTVHNNTFIKGESVWYIPHRDQEDNRINVKIMKVHDDDFPRLYYTIMIETGENKQEKQTVAERLRKADASFPQSNSGSFVSAEDQSLRRAIASSILKEIVTPTLNSPDLMKKEELEAAAECLSLVLVQIGYLGKGGIGTHRYDLCQALLTLQNKAVSAMDEGNLDTTAALLRVLSLSLGFGELTPACKYSLEYLNFEPEASLRSIVSLYNNDVNNNLDLHQASLMWITVTLRSIKTSSLQQELSNLVFSILSDLCFEKEDTSLLALKIMIGLYDCKISESVGENDLERVIFSKLLKSFAKHWQITELDDFLVGCFNSGYKANRAPWWWDHLQTFLECCTRVKMDVFSAACRENTSTLMSSLSNTSKCWFAFRFLCLGAKVSNPLHPDVDEDMLDRQTQRRLSHWKKGMIAEEIEELEDDVLTVFEWIPPKLMVEIESWIDDHSYFDNPDEETTISRMLTWLVFLEYLETAAEDDVRNRISFSAYGNITGAVFFMLSSCLIFLDTEKNGKMAKDSIYKIGDVLRKQEYVKVDSLAMTVLFHTIEVFPTLSRVWWEEDCPKSFSAVVSAFVQAKVAPETLSRELIRIQKSKSLGEMSVQGSIKSREVTAIYLQDECTLSIAIHIPQNFPLRNAEVDGKKTLGIPENRFKRWSLQIRQIINNQDGTLLDALLLWKKNVEKEFEGVEPCPVCYSVLSVKTHDLPNLQCKTCGNCFHSSCLYKWFASSGKNQCVLCQQPWNGTRLQ